MQHTAWMCGLQRWQNRVMHARSRPPGVRDLRTRRAHQHLPKPQRHDKYPRTPRLPRLAAQHLPQLLQTALLLRPGSKRPALPGLASQTGLMMGMT